MNERCKICNNPDGYYSPLFEEVICVDCVDMYMKYVHLLPPVRHIARTSINEQYQAYIDDPFLDPRD